MMLRHLFIVSRETPYLAEYMREQFRDDPTVLVVVDRRGRDQCRPSAKPWSTGAVKERRARPDVDRELRESFHALVTLD